MPREIQTAQAVAKEAGNLLMKYYRKDVAVSYKHKTEPVSTADLESNALIIKRLSEAFPKYFIVSEESGGLRGELTKDPTWIIDPLDGTSNFLAGIPLFAVTITLIKNRQPVLGVIYDPVHDELFSAVKGKGIYFNGKKLPPNGKHKFTMRKLMFLAGRGHEGKDREKHGKIIFALEKEISYFRRLGSAAIMLTSVASGRADAVILTGSKPWDTVAGALLIEEAGGKVTDYCGSAWHIDSPDLVATRGIPHKMIIDATSKIKEAKC